MNVICLVEVESAEKDDAMSACSDKCETEFFSCVRSHISPLKTGGRDAVTGNVVWKSGVKADGRLRKCTPSVREEVHAMCVHNVLLSSPE